MKKEPVADYTLSEPELLGTYVELYPTIQRVLQSYHPETPITGDDLQSFFGLCFGALIDNDSYLTTPQHLRQGAETAAVHALRWAQVLRRSHAVDDPSFLQTVMTEDRSKRKAQAGGLN